MVILCGNLTTQSFAPAPGKQVRHASYLRVRARSAIVGGTPAPAGSFSWLAHTVDHRGFVAGECTGTVVAPYLVLTAGHCAVDSVTQVERDPRGFLVTTGNVDNRLRDLGYLASGRRGRAVRLCLELRTVVKVTMRSN
jgi:hypothetical protein